MTQYIRYVLFIVSFLLSITGFANDRIKCNLASEGITGLLVAGQPYTNVYNCTNTYFPIQLGLRTNPSIVNGVSVTGNCATAPIPFGGTCQFYLTASLQQSTVFGVEITDGLLYFLTFPAVTAIVSPTPPPPSGAVITWPGFNSGFAQADVTGNGFGSFVPNATDSSGHPVIYIFEIIAGPGAITGSQSGSFSLTNVDGSTVVRITATADDALPVAGTPIPVQITNVPTKVIAIFNNTAETIYPVIESFLSVVEPPVVLPRDTWMQAQFGIVDVNTFRFQATKLHRAYINGTNGIAPMTSALVSVPFYSDLVLTPSGGDIPDQYVDWWKSMRVYIYDVQSSLIQTQSAPGVAPATLFTPGPTCISGCSQTTVFSATTIMPTNDPQQLTEYTFAAVDTAAVPPYPIDLTIVNYNFSGVDQIYLPLAMEPYGSNLVGYTGTTVGLTPFRDSMDLFLSQTGWPVYAGLPFPRIPGAYNVAIGDPQLTNTIPTRDALRDNFFSCMADGSNPLNAQCIDVYNLFLSDWTACGYPGAPPPNLLMEKIYGYISFCNLVLPSSGPAFDAYTTLQHTFYPDYVGDFNPYSQLIHETLQMNVYAYSVDDTVGFVRAIGNGITITDGGALGLPNPEQRDLSEITTVSPLASAPGNPFFTKFGVCSPTANSGSLLGGSFQFQLPLVPYYPCEITLEDSLNRLYHFTINSPAPLTSTAANIICDPGDTWCAGVVVVPPQTVVTPTPTP